MFNKILIANRGEIALRVERTCKKMGIRTCAIYSDDDKESLHVRYADEAYHLELDNYLDIDGVLNIAEKRKVEAIHPG